MFIYLNFQYVGFLALEQHTVNVEILKSKEGKYEWAIKTKKGKTTLRVSHPHC